MNGNFCVVDFICRTSDTGENIDVYRNSSTFNVLIFFFFKLKLSRISSMGALLEMIVSNSKHLRLYVKSVDVPGCNAAFLNAIQS